MNRYIIHEQQLRLWNDILLVYFGRKICYDWTYLKNIYKINNLDFFIAEIPIQKALEINSIIKFCFYMLS